MKRLALVIGALAAALCLNGCFSSLAPLYAEDALSCPFAQETHFGAPLADANGETAYRPAFTIRADGHACLRTREDGSTDSERLLLSPLGDGWYVAQQFKADNGRYYYGLVHIEGERVWSYEPACGDFTPEALDQLGVANPWGDVSFGELQVEPGPPSPTTPKRPPGPTTTPFTPPTPEPSSDQTAPEQGGNDGSCEVTTVAQIEALMRAWIQLGRPAQDYGDRIDAPEPAPAP